ncbi:single-stranded-DNA-specific exonuclease RecJ [Clostridium botulinum]|uniref:Single-stranded-DNA-specific exonuclease RecJ n=1 Tax=Clostridium botulinum TaxID=1491 RepID=A0A6B4JLW4_CLOBO|nr:single-stranded-DNA-specific exonuclease RecJ [Clostridium botulinum]EES47990.1 single-stranded-DNA-specific exonuclease RecJ [Clostridium botulinum E1 str. 'BoNT E Beluga']MBN1070225.1 single-stranded-DNA-specific exonuclease RecJ [Clostridium botulinum]MBY6761287.1 single-stranded-DNA-specific exonuclease RecJ [Clostridium botulinum]MBY6920379.1 single-stranded-DNA-specific exonuclease RecJ [Clostridium botulinum]MCR1131271.1 single-stranded-DNA-specific exonuclease RecJ [Clostridium botu
MKERWFVKNIKADYKNISKKYGISELITRLMINRNIVEDDMIKNYINPNYSNFHDPYEMKDIEKAAKILKEKIELKEKIRIIGDYDVDGVISVYILYTALKKCGANVDYEIPDRIKDGYGINKKIILEAKNDEVDTLLTCDNGISAIEQIKYAKELGMTVIVTDHHDIPFVEDEKGDRIFISSEADSIINPKQIECGYKFDKICGAGVAFKLIEVLYEKMKISKEELYKLIEFVAIATVCDVVDLIDENRIFVKNGLKMINNTTNLGLKYLMKETKMDGKEISTYHLGFVIGPCINASGRLDSAKKGLKLLLSQDEEEALNLAKELVELNDERKSMTSDGVEKAIEIIEGSTMKDDKVFVIYIPQVHESLAGIIAGRIREKYNVPTIILTKAEEGVKGSGRSIEEYNMFEELLTCKDLLNKFGGHPMAAGLSLNENNIDLLREGLNRNTKLTEEELIPKITIDLPLVLENINYDMINDLELLEPFGKGNSKPLFGAKNVNAVKAMVLGQNKNVLKIKLKTTSGRVIDSIYFGDIEEFEQYITKKYNYEELQKLYGGEFNSVNLDLVFYPSINEYNGNISIQIVIQNYR